MDRRVIVEKPRSHDCLLQGAIMLNKGLIASTLILFLLGSRAMADGNKQPFAGPIIDAHVHYSQTSWGEYPIRKVMEKFDKGGVEKALVSSTPDDGTLGLHRHSADRIIKFLRPYRTRSDMANWYGDKDVLEYVQARLAANDYSGFGEFHMYDPLAVTTPEMKILLELATKKGLILHSHSGADVIEALAKAAPGLTILWAHAGLSSPPVEIAEIFKKFPQVYADMSFRGGDVLDAKGIKADWLELFESYPERIMLGSDTYIPEQWSDYQGIIDRHRRWLGHLPLPLAEMIASGNALKMLKR